MQLETPKETPPEPIPELIFHDRKLLRRVDHELYTGWEPADEKIKVMDQPPAFKWKGAKIPFSLWTQVVMFMRWSQEEYGEEAMLFFFYHPADRKWAAWVFPQEPRGMTVRMLPDEPMYAEDRRQFGAGWIQAGTVHHHCKGGAFQSGTDRTDEEDRDGVHITLGKMDEEVLDLDIRQVFNGVQSKAHIIDWVELPAFLVECPKSLRSYFHHHACRAIKDGDFPEAWKERIMETIPTQQSFFPHGVAASPATPKTTLINQVPGKRGRGRPRKNVTSGPVGGGSESYNSADQTEWRNRTKNKLRAILHRLSMPPEEAWTLLSQFPSPEVDSPKYNRRKDLYDALLRDGIPVLYAEDLFEELIGLPT